MPVEGPTLAYRRERFGTRLPLDRLYTRAHYWLRDMGGGVYEVGFTRFATRMLGDMVEYQFDVEPGAAIALGSRLGWIEGFKAVSDLYAVGSGTFGGANALLREDITLLESDPCGRGWLYRLEGQADGGGVDAKGYASILDATIDKMLAGRHEGGSDE